MNEQFKQIIDSTFSQLLYATAQVLPRLIGGLLTLLAGWLLAKLISFLLERFLGLIKFDQLFERNGIKRFISAAGWQSTPSQLIRKLIYWLIIILFTITATEVIGWNALSYELRQLFTYVPRILSAVIIFIFGMYFISAVRDLLNGTTTSLGIGLGRLVSNIAYYILLVFLSLTALKQAGVETELLNTNITIILTGILLAFVIAYGLAAREMLSNILATFYLRRIYRIGERLRIGNCEGVIEEIQSIGMVLRTKDERKLIIPGQQLIKQRVEVLPKELEEVDT